MFKNHAENHDPSPIPPFSNKPIVTMVVLVAQKVGLMMSAA